MSQEDGLRAVTAFHQKEHLGSLMLLAQGKAAPFIKLEPQSTSQQSSQSKQPADHAATTTTTSHKQPADRATSTTPHKVPADHTVPQQNSTTVQSQAVVPQKQATTPQNRAAAPQNQATTPHRPTSPTHPTPHQATPATSSSLLSPQMQLHQLHLPPALQNLLATLPQFQFFTSATEPKLSDIAKAQIDSSTSAPTSTFASVISNDNTSKRTKNVYDLTLSPLRMDFDHEQELREVLLKVCFLLPPTFAPSFYFIYYFKYVDFSFLLVAYNI